MVAARWLGRIRRLVQDGRLPPETTALLRDAITSRCRAVVHGAVAGVLPPVRSLGHGVVRRDGHRRWQVSGPVQESTLALGHRNATFVAEALAAAGVDTFLVERCGDQIVLGVAVRDRARALRAIVEASATDGGAWYVRWRYALVRGVVSPGRRRWSRLAARADRWAVHQTWDYDGKQAVGSASAVIVTFWEPRAGEVLERVGVRGSERIAIDSPPLDQDVDGRTYRGRRGLPVETSIERLDAPVDIVVTWVDGSDPEWRRSFERWSASTVDTVGADGRTASRYANNDELRYCLRSLWMYAGWFGRVHLVTCGHTPSWLTQGDRIHVVPHHDIFEATDLPTFNSHAIEARLHRIPGLAEHYVYLNDDVFFGRPVPVEALFTSAGVPRIALSSARVPLTIGAHSRTVDLAAYRSALLIESATGKTPVHKPSHGPFALRRSALYALEERFEDDFLTTAANRFRSGSDISVSSSLAPLHALATGEGVVSDLRVDYVNIEHRRLPIHLARLGVDTTFDAFCLNETEIVVADRASRRSTVARFLERRFPVPAPWEAPD